MTLINPVAQEMVGWTEAEAEGRPLTEVFRIINDQTRQPSESPVLRVLRDGSSAELSNASSSPETSGRRRLTEAPRR